MKISKKLIAVTSIAALFIATRAFALPMTGEMVTMENDRYVPYTMKDARDVIYQSFCLEQTRYFSPGNDYFVDSVGDYASGRNSLGEEINIDPLHDDTKWLYAAFASNVFSGVSDAASRVQHAIWFLEGDLSSDSDYTFLKGYGKGFDDAGWNVVAVNLTNRSRTSDNQSQLVGTAPVPEPATMLLLGAGLFGLAGVQLRRKK